MYWIKNTRAIRKRYQFFAAVPRKIKMLHSFSLTAYGSTVFQHWSQEDSQRALSALLIFLSQIYRGGMKLNESLHFNI